MSSILAGEGDDIISNKEGSIVNGVFVPVKADDEDADDQKCAPECEYSVDDFIQLYDECVAAEARVDEDSLKEASSGIPVYVCSKCHAFKDENDQNQKICSSCGWEC